MGIEKLTRACALSVSTLIVLLFISCRDGTKDGVNQYSSALIVHSKGRQVEFYKLNGTDQMTYWVDEDYPASSVTDWLFGKLRDSGWTQLSYSYLNPQLGSRPTGWIKFVDKSTSEETVVYQLSTNWKDSQDNVLVYGFEYRYPSKLRPQLQKMRVLAIFVPAALAKKQQEAGQRALERFSR